MSDDTKCISSHTCASIGCEKPAKMQCPKCLSLGAPSSYFCSQECFKANWAKHAQSHTRFQKAVEFVPPKFRYTGNLRPSYVTPRVPLPSVPRPEYALTGNPATEDSSKFQNIVPIFTKERIDIIREACQIGRGALDIAARMCVPGAIADDIDRAVHDYIVSKGAYPSPLNYRGFPKSVCLSVNEVICHGIPDMRPLQNGDIINVDVTAYYKGYHGDLNETYTVGDVDARSKELVKASHDSLMAAISIVKPGTPIRDIGKAIADVVHKHGFSIVRSYCGHGIGDLFHCAPNIPHYPNNKAVGVCKEGMVFTIEPMINEGAWEVRHWPDDWTAVTSDGKRSAQFEHTLVVTADGCEILTARTPESRPLWWEEESAREQRIEAGAAEQSPAAPEPAPAPEGSGA